MTWRQMAWTMLWAGFLLLQFILGATAIAKDAPQVHHRQKREWRFHVLYAAEEIPPNHLPQKIGQLTNSFFNPSAKFKISGEGAGDLFAVNDTGEIWVKATLDREKKSSYNLRAEIWKADFSDKLEEDATFVIKVQDVNDHAPVFSETYVRSINERSQKGTAVLTVSATDKDDPTSPNGILEYVLLNGTSYFSIDKAGEISVKEGRLDRETQSQYKLIVQASDSPGMPGGKSATTIVTININDINDNVASFKDSKYHFNVKENEMPPFKISTLIVEDQDEKQNKKPIFTINDLKEVFLVELDDKNDGALMLTKALDFETQASYRFTVTVGEDGVAQPPDNPGPLQKVAEVLISVTDVDEPPVFTQSEYTFSVKEGPIKNNVIGSVSAKDPDRDSNKIRYSIKGQDCPATIIQETGQLMLSRELDREHQNSHTCEVMAHEQSQTARASDVIVTIKVQDINDNKPELVNTGNVYVCENDKNGTVIGTIGATDKDENPGIFQFVLIKKSSNFSLIDNKNNTASIVLTNGGFSTDSLEKNTLEIKVIDGQEPHHYSITSLHIKVCTCQRDRQMEFCKAIAQTGVSVSALVAILLCIVTILVIVILFVMRKRYQKETLVALGKSAGEIHEQLVTYDEEGGGEMDTNGYDVSILSSACHGGTLRSPPGPPVYAVAKKPSACKGDMAMMIEVKKDEADHDRDGIPYDTLHIYGYEGTESLAGSLSSLDSSSFGSNVDYDFLSDWGPRFRTLAQLYGVDGSDSDSSY